MRGAIDRHKGVAGAARTGMDQAAPPLPCPSRRDPVISTRLLVGAILSISSLELGDGGGIAHHFAFVAAPAA